MSKKAHSHGSSGADAPNPLRKKESKPLIPEKYQDAAYIGALVLSILVFLGGAIFTGGNFFNASDNVSSSSFIPFLEESKQQGYYPLWMPYIFGGLPNYASMLISADRFWDVTAYVFFGLSKIFGALFNSDAARVSFFYMLYAAGMYLLMRHKKFERFTAFFTAFSAVFSTFIITWILIGHNTKPVALLTFPYIFICIDKLREKFSFLYAGLLVIAMHILVASPHVQMMFYGFCAFGLYFLVELIHRAVKKDMPVSVVKSGAVFAVAVALAFGMSADQYLSTLEYTPYSTRGTAPIEQKTTQKQDESGGFDYEYATNWSFSPEEVMTFFVPNYYGFGKLEYSSALTNNRKVMVHTYWGQMPFTDGANYMGIGVLALALMGAWRYRKESFVQFLIALSLFSLLLSFGKNLPVLYNAFFYGVPMFNKFRAPAMALALIQFAFPILAGFGIRGLLHIYTEGSDKERKSLMYWLFGAIGFLVLGFAYGAVAQEGYIRSVAESPTGKQFTAQGAQELHKFIYTQMINDWYVTALLGIAFMALAYMFVQKKISQTVLFAGLAFLLIADLWRVDVRGMEVSKEDPKRTVFKRTDVVDFLKKDNSVYRIADFTNSGNVPASFLLQNIHGYHSAKLRVYQDLLDVAGSGGGSVVANPFLWNLMNVKYIITDRAFQGMQTVFQSREEKQLVYGNPDVLPRAFFVKSAEVASPMDILKHLKAGDFNPVEKAFIEKPLPTQIDSMIVGSTAKLEEFKNEYLKFSAKAQGNNLLFISEIYYPAGWAAYIDGKPVETIKTNFAFRGVIVPPGDHTVEMRFASPKFELGRTVSVASNAVAFALLGAGLLLARRKKSEE